MSHETKIILVTGASSGMGKATALRLIQDGHTVYGAARREERLKELEIAGGHAIRMDLTDHASIIAGVERIMREQGRMDVLVNNAGYAVYGAVEDTSLADAQRQLEVNLFGPGRLTQLVLPHMRRQRSGRIVNVTSMGGKIYTPLGAWYHASKHALEGWSDCLRIELAPFGIDVVVIEPGAIQTEFGEVMTTPMIERSGSGAYADLAATMKRTVAESYGKPNASSPPSVVAELIARVIRAKKPKTRYAVGKLAKPMMFMRKWLGDRLFDRVIMSQMR